MAILNYTDDHKKLQARLRDFAENEIAPYADEWEKNHIVPREAWRKMGEAGFLCPSVKKEYGGPGLDFLSAVLISRELGKTNQSGLLSPLHSDIVVPYIESFGSEAMKKKYLPGCVSGDIITAVAMTEPDVGSDLASMTTTAVEEGDQVVLNGAKTFISNGILCDLVIVAAKDPSVENPYNSISLYVVEDGTPGFKKGNQLEKMGMHSQDTAELFFSDCRIPKENQLGSNGEGFIMLMEKLQQERLVTAVMALAKAEFILDWTIDYCKKTHVSGKPLSASQSVKFSIAEMVSDVNISRIFVDKLIADHVEEKSTIEETCMAKYWVTDMAIRLADRCMDLIGPYAYDEACPIVREWRGIKVMSIFAGTNEIMKGIVAQSVSL